MDDHDDGIRHVGDLGLGLADADGLDHDDVKRRGERARCCSRGGREASEALADRGRSNVDVAVGGIDLDPRPVAEQRSARPPR